jgi:tol-pal system protein YbgF
LQDQVKSNTATYEEMKPKIGKMREELDLIAAAKSSHLVSTPTPRIEVVNKEAAPANRDKSIQDEYMKAYGLFSENNYLGAIEAFSSFIKKYPASEYAGNAQYWIGECHYTQQDFPKALSAFNRLLKSYPKGKKVPDAMLKIGFSYISMNDQAKAKVALQNLVDKYPNSQAAIKARERLSHF